MFLVYRQDTKFCDLRKDKLSDRYLSLLKRSKMMAGHLKYFVLTNFKRINYIICIIESEIQ